MNDPISDMLTRIRNASRALLPEVAIPHSKLKESIAHVLKREGYVAEVAVEGKPPQEDQAQAQIHRPQTASSRACAGSARRACGATSGAQEVPRVRGGLGMSILSTSEGIMTGTQARKKNVGGELLCEVW